MLIDGPDRLELLRTVTDGLFDTSVGIGVTDPRLAEHGVYPSEAAHVMQARLIRRREFAAGRNAARIAMQSVGLPASAIPAASDRSPVWPEGLAGSISHTQTCCVAVVSQTAAGIGIDLEEATPLDQHLMSSICSQSELARIAGPHQGTLAKLIFCAKEAAYKAQYPLTNALFSFDCFDVTLNLEQFEFAATFLEPAGIFKEGDSLQGRFAQTADHFVTAVTIGSLAGLGD